MRVGDSVTIVKQCAGAGFCYTPGHPIVVTEDNIDMVDSLVVGGIAEEGKPAGWKAKSLDEIDGRPRILVFVPMAPRLEPETVSALLAQEGVEYFDLMFTHDNPHTWPGSERMKNIQINFEKMRRVALSEGYSKVWIVESDVIPPVDALKNLLAVSADVVSGLYLMRRREHLPNIMSEAGPVLSYSDIRDHWGETIPMSGGCTGCLLIDVKILSGFSFLTGYAHAPDSEFMTYCREKKVNQVAHLGVVCGHKRPDGIILWPDAESGVRKVA